MSDYDEPAATAEITIYVADWLRHKGHPELARQWETELKIATRSVELAARRQPGETRQAWRSRLRDGGWPDTAIDELDIAANEPVDPEKGGAPMPSNFLGENPHE